MQLEVKTTTKNFQQKLNILSERAVKEGKVVIKAFVDDLQIKSISQVPKDTTTLASSCFQKEKQTPTSYTGIVGYGGNGNPINPKTEKRASTYMITVHEDLNAHHPIGKAKFLEDPANELLPTYVDIINTNIKQEAERLSRRKV